MLQKYSMFEDQISRIMASCIQYMHKTVHELMYKEFFQVLIYRECPKAANTYKEFTLSKNYQLSVNVLIIQRIADYVS